MSSTPHYLVIDDHSIVRMGLRHLLGHAAVLHEAGTLEEASALLAEHPIVLALLDLSLGEQFGLAALPRLRERRPGLKVIVLTSLPEDLYAERALRAGADGYVMKGEPGTVLLQAIASVMAGEVHLSSALRSRMLRRLTQPAAPAEATGAARPELSPREVEVLRLVAAGRSTREIAEALNRSVKTIETHKQALKVKLGAETPAMLVRVAVSWFEDARP